MMPAHNAPMDRLFTVDEANRMLPLVRRIVSDAVRDYWRWQDKVQEFEVAALRSTVENPDETAEQLQRHATRLAEEIDGYIEELHDLGVLFKGFDTGLVDFASEMDGRPVLLCWQLGEDSIRFWHEPDAGFIGRQPLPELQVN
jgi:Uncharacterized conserved protein